MGILKRYWWIVVIIAMVAWFYYPLVVDGWFQAEDFFLLTKAELSDVKTFGYSNSGLFADTTFNGANAKCFRPAESIEISLMNWLFGDKAWGWHLVNVLTHLGICILIGFICLKLTGSWIGGVLFALCPMIIEPVCYNTAGHNALFSALSVFLGLWMVLKHKHWILVALVFITGLCFKEDAVMLLPGMVMVIAFGEKKYISRYLEQFLLLIVVFAGYLAIRTYAIGQLECLPDKGSIFAFDNIWKTQWIGLMYIWHWLYFFPIIAIAICGRHCWKYVVVGYLFFMIGIAMHHLCVFSDWHVARYAHGRLLYIEAFGIVFALSALWSKMGVISRAVVFGLIILVSSVQLYGYNDMKIVEYEDGRVDIVSTVPKEYQVFLSMTGVEKWVIAQNICKMQVWALEHGYNANYIPDYMGAWVNRGNGTTDRIIDYITQKKQSKE